MLEQMADKMRALKSVMVAVEKQFGKGSVMTLGDDEEAEPVAGRGGGRQREAAIKSKVGDEIDEEDEAFCDRADEDRIANDLDAEVEYPLVDLSFSSFQGLVIKSAHILHKQYFLMYFYHFYSNTIVNII